jgi:hypothetical protein
MISWLRNLFRPAQPPTMDLTPSPEFHTRVVPHTNEANYYCVEYRIGNGDWQRYKGLYKSPAGIQYWRLDHPHLYERLYSAVEVASKLTEEQVLTEQARHKAAYDKARAEYEAKAKARRQIVYVK